MQRNVHPNIDNLYHKNILIIFNSNIYYYGLILTNAKASGAKYSVGASPSAKCQ